MTFPIESLVGEFREFGLFVGALIGFGFGFVLERSGFGRAPKLAAQFYLYDMTVFKVMFGAIVTAMLGTVAAAGIGLVDLTALAQGAVSGTFVWPMLFGGLMLGAGFIISGYCPGTSLVGSASGNIDAMFTIAGVAVGSVLFGEVYPLVEGFHLSGEQGQIFLYQLFGIPPAVVAIGVTLMAVGGFIGAEKVEKIMTKRITVAATVVDEELRSRPSSRRWAFGIYGAVGVVTIVTLFFPVAKQAEAGARVATPITAADLARDVIDAPWSVRIIDIRDNALCATERVTGAECVPAAQLEQLGLAFSTGARKLVIVNDGSATPIPAAANAYPGELRVLEGGHAAWHAYALVAPEPPDPAATSEVRDANLFRAAVHSALTGVAAPPPVAAGPVGAFVPKKKKGGGCN